MKPSIRLAATLLGAAPTLAQNDPTLQLSTDGPFNFQFLISMGISITGGANIGPVLGAAENTIAGNMTSFSE